MLWNSAMFHVNIPSNWRIESSDDFFFKCLPPQFSVPHAGWKIRFTVHPFDISQAIHLTSAFAESRQLPFKYAKDWNAISALCSKLTPIKSSGKLLTIYTGESTEDFIRIAEAFIQATSKAALRPGCIPYSDKKLTELVSYRFGSYANSATILSEAGEVHYDRRDIFTLPPWIEDPFEGSKDMEAPIDGRCLANYAHIRLLSRNAATSTFSAAHNPVTSQSERADVVLKAARPNLWLINQNCYAEDLLRHERDILEIAKQRGIDFLPSALDFFIEDKTAFLVLSSPRPPHLKNLEEHLLEKGGFAPHRSLKLAKSIIQKIYSLHSKNIAWGDAAARNILLSDTDDVFLIDFETANADPKEDVFKNDMMDIGKLLFSLVLPLPADTLSLINKNQCVGWIRMLSEAKYPEALLNSIYSCYSTHPPSAATLLSTLVAQTPEPSWGAAAEAQEEEEEALSIQKLLTFRKGMWEGEGQDASLLYGYTGYTLCRKFFESIDPSLKMDDSEKKRLVQFFIDQRSENEAGLDGHAGIALAMLALGEKESAASLLRLTLQAKREQPQSPYLFRGISGEALVYLKFFDETGDKEWLQKAEAISNFFCRVLREEKVYWDENGKIWLGLAGVCGIIIFLFAFSNSKRATGSETGREALYTAKKGINFVREQCIKQWDGRLALPQYVGTTELSRNLAFGSAGLALALCADPNAENEEHHDLLSKILLPVSPPSMAATFTPEPGLIFGLAGEVIANVKAYERTGDERFEKQASSILREIKLFLAVEEECEIDDLASGNLGIAYALAQTEELLSPAFIAF